MDTFKLGPGQAVVAIGGVVLLVSLFLNWSEAGSAFDSFSGVDIIMLLIALATLGYVGASGMGSAAALPSNAPLILAALAIVTIGWSGGWDLEYPSAGFGAWIALPASVAIVWGSIEASLASPAQAARATSRPASPAAAAGAAAPTAPIEPVAPPESPVPADRGPAIESSPPDEPLGAA